jgi:hypothetical protein
MLVERCDAAGCEKRTENTRTDGRLDSRPEGWWMGQLDADCNVTQGTENAGDHIVWVACSKACARAVVQQFAARAFGDEHRVAEDFPQGRC